MLQGLIFNSSNFDKFKADQPFKDFVNRVVEIGILVDFVELGSNSKIKTPFLIHFHIHFHCTRNSLGESRGEKRGCKSSLSLRLFIWVLLRLFITELTKNASKTVVLWIKIEKHYSLLVCKWKECGRKWKITDGRESWKNFEKKQQKNIKLWTLKELCPYKCIFDSMLPMKQF